MGFETYRPLRIKLSYAYNKAVPMGFETADEYKKKNGSWIIKQSLWDLKQFFRNKKGGSIA